MYWLSPLHPEGRLGGPIDAARRRLEGRREAVRRRRRIGPHQLVVRDRALHDLARRIVGGDPVSEVAGARHVGYRPIF